MSVRVPLPSLVILSGMVLPVQAQQAGAAARDVVVIDDSGPPPRSLVESYSGTCPNGRTYALEVSRGRDGEVRLAARHQGKTEPVDKPTILEQVTETDAYAVHMHCGPAAAGFETRVSKSGGQVMTQSILVSDRTGVSVYPAQTAGHSG